MKLFFRELSADDDDEYLNFRPRFKDAWLICGFTQSIELFIVDFGL